MRAFRQHVERPGHGAGRCFMAREEDGGYLIHHLLQGEGIAGFGMLRFDQRLEDILVRWLAAPMEALIAGFYDRAEHIVDRFGGL